MLRKVALLTCPDRTSEMKEDYLLLKEFEKSNFKTELLNWQEAKEDQFDFLILRSTWDYVDYYDDFLLKMKSFGEKLLNPFPMIKENSDKIYLCEFYKERPNDIIPTFLGTQADFKEERLIVKKRVGAGGGQVFEIVSKQGFQEFQTEDHLIQPFYQEIYQGEYSSIFFNGNYSHTVLKKPASKNFKIHEKYGGTYQKVNITNDGKDWCQSFLSRENLPLYARVDYLITQEGPKLLELELIEPSLFLNVDDKAPALFVSSFKEKFIASNAF